MTEQEEFEFRLRYENEKAAQAGATHTESYRAKAVKPSGDLGDFFTGALEGLKGFGRGVEQRAAELGVLRGVLPPTVQGRLYEEERKRREERDYGGKDTGASAIGRTVGGMIPYTAAMFLPGGQSLPASTASSALMGAGMGWLNPATSGEDALTNAAIGGIGAGVGNVGARMLLPTTARTMTQSQKELLDIARREGIPLRTSEATGSAAIKNMEQVAANRPFTAGQELRFNEAQTKALNRAMTSRLGTPVSEINPARLKQFQDELGAEIGAAVQGKTVGLANEFQASVAQLARDSSKGGGLTLTPDIKQLITKSFDLIKKEGKISGETAQAIKSKLQDRMRDAYNSENTELGNALQALANGLDDAIGGTMSKTEKAAWETARRRYANYKAIEDIMQRPTREGALGDIPVNKLASALERQFSGSYAKGSADLAELARLGQVIKPPQRNALLGGSPIPGAEFIKDAARAMTYPPLQSSFTQSWLSGSYPGIRQLRDSPAAVRSLDAALRAAGLLSVEDLMER